MSGVLLVAVAVAGLVAVVASAVRRLPGRAPRGPAVIALAALGALGVLPPLSGGGSAALLTGCAVVVAGGAVIVQQLLLLRRRLVTSAARSWIDVATGVPGALALVWAFATAPMVQGAQVTEARAVLLLTPLGVVWLAGTFCLTGAFLLRPVDRRMLLLAVASALLVGAEVGSASAASGQVWGDALAGALRPAAAALVALAALLRDRHEAEQSEESGLDIVLAPVALTAQSIALLAWHLVSPFPVAAAWAALATVVLSTVKTVVVFQQLDVLNALREQALTDALTGLGNRRALERVLAVVDDGLPVALVAIDLDRFKAVNDTLGHGAGDALLQVLAGRLREGSSAREVVVRLGGDEFALVVPGADLESVHHRAVSAVAAIGRPVQLGDEVVQVGASAGVAIAPLHAATAAGLQESADAAMYTAKRVRGTVVVAEHRLTEGERRQAERRAADRRAR